MRVSLDNMDQLIPAAQKRKQRLHTGGVGLLFVLSLCLAFWGFRSLIKPVLTAGEMEYALVERGPVFESITSTGKVELENHHTILATVTTVLSRTIASPGQKVMPGDTLLILDSTPLQKELRDKLLQLQSLKNSMKKLELTASIEAMDNDFVLMSGEMEINRTKGLLEDERMMYAMGGSPQSAIRALEEKLLLQEAEYEILKKKRPLLEKAHQATAREIEIQWQQKTNEMAAIKQQIEKLVVRAPVNGVVVSISGEPGSMVTKDRELVRLSDLSTYKITGKVGNALSEQVLPGGEVEVIIDSRTRTRGIIGNIRPVVQENNVYFDIFPEQKDHPRFRPDMVVELRIITAYRENALRLKDGTFYDGSKKIKVFRVEGGKAVAVEMTTGMKNQDYIEVTTGLKEGDKIIISDVDKVKHLEEVEIK
ncbi:MAG: efflux RND transporter periplasmic adaptor subunit [Cyclobacteriaceae bacterium]|nr:efflux RND transporter periplasmic adaptor subunit [Cyclobacteriaceae bacterium]